MTILVAMSNALQSTKDFATANGGYVLTGVDDQVIIHQARDAAPTGSLLVFSEGTANLSGPVILNKRLVYVWNGGTFAFPGATANEPIISVETDGVHMYDPRCSGSGTRGNGIGILLGGLTQAVHSCLVVAPRCFNMNTGIEFGIVASSSSGDNAVIDPDISACDVGVKSRGFVNFLFGAFIRTCNTGIMCTADRPHQKLVAHAPTILSWLVRAIDVQRGFGTVFHNAWVEQTDSGSGAGTDVIRVGTDGSSTFTTTSLTFTGTLMMSPGEAVAVEDYIFAIHNSNNLLVEHMELNTSGPMPEIACVREEATNSGGNNRFRKITIGPGTIPSDWNLGKIISKAGTGEIIIEEVPDITGQSQSATIGKEHAIPDYDYTIGHVRGGAFNAVYYAKERNGNLKVVATNGGSSPTQAKAGDTGWNTQTSSALKTVLDGIWASNISMKYLPGTFDFGFQFVTKPSPGMDNIEIAGSGIDKTFLRNFVVGNQDFEPLSFDQNDRLWIHDMTVSAGGDAPGTPTGTTDACDAVDIDAGSYCLIERVKVIASRDRAFVFDGKDVGQVADFNTLRDCEVDGTQDAAVSDTSMALAEASAGTGQIPNGTYTYKIAVMDDNWRESVLSVGKEIIISSGPSNVSITSIPTGPAGTRARKIYRKETADADYWLVVNIFDNTTTSFTDDLSPTTIKTAGSAIIGNSNPPDATIVGNGFEFLAGQHSKVINCKARHPGRRAVNIVKASAVAGQPNKKASFNTVEGCEFYECVQHAIAITSSDGNKVRNNNIYNNSQLNHLGASFSSHGITITVTDTITADDNHVVDNHVYDDQGTPTQNRGISIGSTDVNRTIVALNTSRDADNPGGGFVDGGTLTSPTGNVT